MCNTIYISGKKPITLIMQVILGANGQIADELAKELKRNYTSAIRLVSRNPIRVNETDDIFPGNLLDEAETANAVKGTEIAYLTVGLPLNSAQWAAQFPVIMKNVINACKKHGTRLVYFDNTYMYPQTGVRLTEETAFQPFGSKGRVRAQIASMLLDEMRRGKIEAVICRAPEFYGPGKTQSITRSFVFENIKRNKTIRVPVSDKTLRTLIWTPDAGRATAMIGNTFDCYQQTWHLPCDDNRLTYQQIIEYAATVRGSRLPYSVMNRFIFKIGALFSNQFKELQELLPRYGYDNIFDSAKFKDRFPKFPVTTYQEGIAELIRGF